MSLALVTLLSAAESEQESGLAVIWSVSCHGICSPIISLCLKCSLERDPCSFASGSWESRAKMTSLGTYLEKLDLGGKNGFAVISPTP